MPEDRGDCTPWERSISTTIAYNKWTIIIIDGLEYNEKGIMNHGMANFGFGLVGKELIVVAVIAKYLSFRDC